MTEEPEIPLPQLLECVRRHARLGFSRSGGKGGQNVNKVATKVLARVRVGDLDVLDATQAQRVRDKLARRINDSDELQVFADDERNQARNREIAIERLARLIARAARPVRPRIRTRTPRRAREQRLEEKKQRSARKRDRRIPEDP